VNQSLEIFGVLSVFIAQSAILSLHSLLSNVSQWKLPGNWVLCKHLQTKNWNSFKWFRI